MITWLARLTTTRRGPVLATLAVLAVVLGFQIPNIRVDPSVESLISSYEGGENVAERFKETFGDSSRTMVLLVQADDVFAQPVLQYVHDLGGALEELDFVESVVSLTRTPLPRRVEADPDAALDDLDDLDSLDDLEAEYDELDEGEIDDGYDPAVIDALVELVEADPARFPGGFQVLGPQLSLELEATAIAEGDEVTPEDVVELRNTLAQTDLLEGRLVSRDHTLVVTAMVLADGDSRETRERVSALRQLLVDHAPPAGAHARLGGLPYMRSVIVENIRSDQIFLVPMTLVVCMLLLAVFLRWFAGVVLPIAAVAITAVMVVGGMAVAGEPFNILNNIIPTLLIIIGISDSIHIIGRYREELVAGDGTIAAGVRTVNHMAVACLLTSVTTAVGLGSLVVSKTAMLRHFGLTAAVGVMVAYVVTITFLPAVLTWLRPPKAAPAPSKGSGTLENAIESMTRRIMARPWLVLLVAALLMGVTGYQATQLVVDHALLDQFDEEDPVYITTRLLEEKLDGVRPFEISLESDQEGRFNDAELLEKLDEVLAWANERPEVLSTMSPMRLMRHTLALLSRDETARTESLASDEVVLALSHLLSARGEDDDPLKTWVSPDRRHLRLQLKVRDVGAQATMALADDLQARLSAVLPPDVSVGFTGEAYDGSAGMDAVVTDLLSSLMLAVAIIFVLLTLLFRSLRLGLLSIPPNLIPLVFTMAYMVWRDIPLNAATVIIFSISLGLAVDGTIHVLARF